MSAKEFKESADEWRKSKRRVARRIRNRRLAIEEFESKKSLKPTERKKHQELCARVIELGNEESGHDLQQKELEKAIRARFI